MVDPFPKFTKQILQLIYYYPYNPEIELFIVSNYFVGAIKLKNLQFHFYQISGSGKLVHYLP